MSQRRSREEMRAGFHDRMKEDQDRKEGGFYSNLFRKDIQIPFMKNGEGYHTIDILDYIAGANDPKPGKVAFVFEFYVYPKEIGAGASGVILSLAKTFGTPDPVSEDLAKKRAQGADKKLIAKMDPPSPRALFNVICLDTEAEEKKGVQVLHTSSYLLTDYLREMAKVIIRPGMEGKIDPIFNFCDPETGKSVKYKREGESVNTRYVLHQFVDRIPPGYVIPDSILEKVFVLDELIYIPSYEEIGIWYYGKGQAMPSERTLRQGQEEVAAPVRSRAELAAEAEKKSAAPVEKSASVNPCPKGHVFGKEIDKFPEDCEPCTVYKDCSREARKLTEADQYPPEKKEEPKKEESAADTSRSRTRGSAAPEASTEGAPAGGRRRRRE